MPLQNGPGKTCAHELGEMPPIFRLWLTSTLVLGALMFIAEWLTGGSGASSRLTLAACASACLLLVMRRWWHKAVVARLKPLLRTLSASETGKGFGGRPSPGRDEIANLEALVHQVCCGPGTSRQTGTDSSYEVAATSLCRGLSGNLKLAAEHVESIKTLLEISQTHQQPIPRAAFQNLELVSKHLRTIERQFDAGSPNARLEGALQFS